MWHVCVVTRGVVVGMVGACGVVFVELGVQIDMACVCFVGMWCVGVVASVCDEPLHHWWLVCLVGGLCVVLLVAQPAIGCCVCCCLMCTHTTPHCNTHECVWLIGMWCGVVVVVKVTPNGTVVVCVHGPMCA